MSRRAAIVVAGVVGAAVIAGLLVVGPPSEERTRRLDARRADDLGQIARDVSIYRSRHGVLPASLAALAAEAGLGLRATDPETGIGYEYRVLDANRYELCAEFAAATTTPPGPHTERFAVHDQGRHCVTVDATEEAQAP